MVKTILITGATDGTGKALKSRLFCFSRYLGDISRDSGSTLCFFFKSYFPLAI